MEKITTDESVLELTEKDEEEIEEIEELYEAAKKTRADYAEEFNCDIEDVDEIFEETYPGETIDD
jgi:hypothetical protein